MSETEFIKTSDRMQLCVVCNEISTTNRGENNEPLCATCSNDLYFRKLRNGEIVELKIDMLKVKPSTLLQMQALIQKDVEAYTIANK